MAIAETLAEQRARHLTERGTLLRSALAQSDWTQRRAAALLGCQPSTLQRALSRHADLLAELASQNSAK